MSAPAPSARARTRRIALWAILGIVAILVGLAATAIQSATTWTQRGLLDPDSAGPDGARALAEILRGEGVDVSIVRSASAAATALDAIASADSDATLVLPDDTALSDDELTALATAAADVVMLDPGQRGARLLVEGGRIAGYAPAEPLTPDCGLESAQRAGAIVAGTLFTATTATACYPDGDGAALLQVADDDRTTTVVDGTVLFTNDTLAQRGNASLGVQLLGRNAQVVWLVPEPVAAEGVGALTPSWTTPVLVLLALAAVAAALWRGRRFGPLVRETLPVSVRAGEADAGRAALYARGGDLAHAAGLLREGALRRCARALSMPPGAAPEAIADAVARLLESDAGTAATNGPGDAHADLIGAAPEREKDLLALRTRLARLEQAVHAAGRPGREQA